MHRSARKTNVRVAYTDPRLVDGFALRHAASALSGTWSVSGSSSADVCVSATAASARSRSASSRARSSCALRGSSICWQTTLVVPSLESETPYIIPAISIVRFWCVTIITCDSLANPSISRRNRCRLTSSSAGSTSSIR